jgi:phage portal protein BeeE
MVDPTVTSTWGTGVGEQNGFLVDYTFRPWAIRIEQAVSTFLMAGPQFIKFNFDALLRAKTKDRYESYTAAIDGGFMNPDEVRALEDLPPLPKGQGKHFWRPANMQTIDKALEPAPEPVAPAAPIDPAAPDPNESKK